jgi:hypothetical protein
MKSPEIRPLRTLRRENIFDPSNFLGEVIQIVSQDNRGPTAGLDTDEMMQIFLLSTRIRRKHRDSNDTSFETCLRYCGVYVMRRREGHVESDH